MPAKLEKDLVCDMRSLAWGGVAFWEVEFHLESISGHAVVVTTRGHSVHCFVAPKNEAKECVFSKGQRNSSWKASFTITELRFVCQKL